MVKDEKLQELKDITRQIENLTEEGLRAQKKERAELAQNMKAYLQFVRQQTQEALEKSAQDRTKDQHEHELRVASIILTTKLAFWDAQSDDNKTSAGAEVATLVQRAAGGDKDAQTILKGADHLLKEKDIDNPGRPSLDWEKETPEKIISDFAWEKAHADQKLPLDQYSQLADELSDGKLTKFGLDFIEKKMIEEYQKLLQITDPEAQKQAMPEVKRLLEVSEAYKLVKGEK